MPNLIMAEITGSRRMELLAPAKRTNRIVALLRLPGIAPLLQPLFPYGPILLLPLRFTLFPLVAPFPKLAHSGHRRRQKTRTLFDRRAIARIDARHAPSVAIEGELRVAFHTKQ